MYPRSEQILRSGGQGAVVTLREDFHELFPPMDKPIERQKQRQERLDKRR
jgi:hypothetical protein